MGPVGSRSRWLRELGRASFDDGFIAHEHLWASLKRLGDRNSHSMSGLYLIGLGLGDERDITVRGLEIVRRCAHVYLESYTAILGVDRLALERFYGRPVAEADRDRVEQDDLAAVILVRAPASA